MRWPSNPYAIVKHLVGKAPPANDGQSADKFLTEALLTESAITQFERLNIRNFRDVTLDDALDFFAEISLRYDKPVTLAEARKLELVQAASQAYGQEKIEKLLPFLVPVIDVRFGDEPATHVNSVTIDASYVNTGPLVVEDISYLDPQQGLVGDCYLIAAMIALAWTARPLWSQSLQASGYSVRTPSFKWQFHEEGRLRGAPIEVTGRVPVENGLLCFADSDPDGEFWPSLVEKAYVMRAKRNAGSRAAGEPTSDDYQIISFYEKPWRACQQLVGGSFQRRRHNTDLDGAILAPASLMDRHGKAKLPVMAVTAQQISGHKHSWHTSGLYRNHAYAVLGKMRDSGHIVLRNPHGKPTVARDGYFDGSTWDCGERNPVVLNKAGVFAIEPALFNQCFRWLGWVVL
jgi:predicted RNA-binding protein with TRAM domain